MKIRTDFQKQKVDICQSRFISVSEVALKHLNFLIWACLLCTSCIYSGQLVNGVVFGKVIWFLFFSGLFVLLITLSVVQKGMNIKFNLLDLAVLLFLTYGLILNLITNGLLLSESNLEISGLIFLYLGTRLFYPCQKNKIKLVSFTLLGLIFTQVLIASLQYNGQVISFNTNFRFTGSFLNPSIFAIYLSSLIVCCFSLMLFLKSKTLVAINAVFFVIGSVFVVLTYCRSSLIGIATAIILVLEIKLKLVTLATTNYLFGKKKLLISFFTITVFANIACLLYFLKKDSADGRILIWKISLAIFRDNFFKGIGPGNFQAHFLNYQSAYFKANFNRISDDGVLAGNVPYAFNHFLQIGIEQGITGIILFGSLIFILVKIILKHIDHSKRNMYIVNRSILFGADGAITVILVSSVFSYSMSILPVQILFYISVAVVSSYNETEVAGRYRILEAIHWKPAFAIVGIIVGIVFIVYAKNMFFAYQEWRKIENTGYEGDDINKLEKYNFILDQDPWFLVKKGEYLINNGKFLSAIRLLEHIKGTSPYIEVYYLLGDAYISVGRFGEAEEQYQYLSYAIPNILRPKYLLARLYFNTNQFEKLRNEKGIILNFKPKFKSHAVQQMMHEVQNNDYK